MHYIFNKLCIMLIIMQFNIKSSEPWSQPASWNQLIKLWKTPDIFQFPLNVIKIYIFYKNSYQEQIEFDTPTPTEYLLSVPRLYQ